MSTFEDHLMDELRKRDADRAHFPAPMSRRRVRAVAAGGALAVAGAAAATLALSATTATPKAFAVTEGADGSLTVTLNDIAQMSKLNQTFADMGVPVRAIPVTPDCVSPAGVIANVWPDHTMTNTVVLGTHFDPGEHEVIGARQLSSGQVELNIVTISNGPVPTCFPEP